jgi:hypothetical protein
MSTLPFTSTPANPEIADLLNQFKKMIFLTMNCHHMGTIQSFDAVKLTATVTINYKQSHQRLDSKSGTYKTVLIDYPQLIDVPVIFLGGGKFYQSFPIKAGDQCLLIFNDRDLDNYIAGSTTSPPNTPRCHSFSDGLALVFKKDIAGFDTTHAGTFSDKAGVGVGENSVKIYNDTHTLNGLLQELITEIKNLTVTCAGSGSPSSTPINAASLTDTATKIAGLLE